MAGLDRRGTHPDYRGADAIREAKRALVVDPEDVAARVRLFRGYQELDRSDDALIVGYRLLGDMSEDVTLRLELARLEMHARRWDQVITLLASYESDRAACAILAAAYDAVGQSTMASTLRGSLDVELEQNVEYEGRRSYYAAQLASLVDHARPVTPAGKALVSALHNGQYVVCEEKLQQWQVSIEDEHLRRLATADWLLLQYRSDEVPDIADFADVPESFHGAWHNRLGDAAQDQGRYPLARSHYRKATLLNPQDTNAWLDLARIEFLLGNSEAARKACRQLLKNDEAAPEADMAEELLRELEMDRSAVGTTAPGLYGLVWWERGGGILSIEVARSKHVRGLTLTGTVGRTLEDSVRVALQYVTQNIPQFSPRGVHVHFPGLETPKDGSSAGAAIAALLIQLARGIVVTKPVGITGEITLTGSVLPIGGMREKLIAAHLHGLSHVYIPRGNAHELLQVPVSVRRTLAITQIESIRELENCLWPTHEN